MEENSAQENLREETNQEKETTVRDLLVWTSPSRPPIELTRELFATAVSICLLLSIIVSFFQEFMLVFLIWTVLFFIVALSKRPPENVEHKITTQGIISMGQSYLWDALGPFWITKSAKHYSLNISQVGNFLGPMSIILNSDTDPKEVQNILAKYLPFIEKPEKSRTDKFAEWFTSKLNVPSPAQKSHEGKVI